MIGSVQELYCTWRHACQTHDFPHGHLKEPISERLVVSSSSTLPTDRGLPFSRSGQFYRFPIS